MSSTAPRLPLGFLDDYPAKLRAVDQWVCWRTKPRRDGKTAKIPVNAHTGRNAKIDDPSTWGPFSIAYAHAQRTGLGIGFVLTNSDSFAFVDLDECAEQNGALSTEATATIKRFASFTEYSQSGRGLHIFTIGKLPPGKRKGEHGEMYDRGRFVAMTGRRVPRTPATLRDCTKELGKLHAQWFGQSATPTAPTAKPDAPNTDQHRTDPAELPGSDADLLRVMVNAKNGAKAKDLYRGRWQAHYPSQSEADQALCLLLAFYTGRNAQRIDRIFRTSGMMRPKWDERHASDGSTYGEMTIGKAIAHCTNVYRPGKPEKAKTQEEPDFDHWLQAARLFVQGQSFAPYVPRELQCARGYRTDGTDTRVADALLDLAQEQRSRTVRGTLEEIRRRAGVGSKQTAANALVRLDGWFVTRTDKYTWCVVARTLDDSTPPTPVYYHRPIYVRQPTAPRSSTTPSRGERPKRRSAAFSAAMWRCRPLRLKCWQRCAK